MTLIDRNSVVMVESLTGSNGERDRCIILGKAEQENF